MTSIRNFSRIPARHILSAFSLIELMVVVTLIAILAVSISINLHGAQDDHALQIAAEDLASAIRFAYEESRIKSIAHRISFIDSGTSYRIESATGDQNQPYRPVVGVAGVCRHLASGIRIKTIKPSFGGQMDGVCEELLCISPSGFDGEITLCNRRGDTIKIEILAGSGQVYVEG